MFGRYPPVPPPHLFSNLRGWTRSSATCLFSHRQPSCPYFGFQVSQGHWLGGIGFPLDDAEARDKFGQGWKGTRLDLQRELLGVDQWTAGFICHSLGDLKLEGRTFGKRPWKHHP